MSAITVENFSGISPRTGPTLLAQNQAQVASNLKLQSGEIRPWKSPTLAYTPYYSDTQTIYKFFAPSGTTPSFIWLEWESVVDVVPGPIADLTDDRLYFTSTAFGPKKTNWALASGNSAGSAPFPNVSYEMGVPFPTDTPTVTASGGTAPTETRTYIYTYVTQFGSVLEESAPSPPSAEIAVNFSGGTVAIANIANSGASGNYNFVYKRIYRSVVGSTSVGYELVAQIPYSITSFSDTVTSANLGQTLPSLYFTPPPTTLQGLVALPNGILAGFTGNQIWFCEPYLPHAWPVSYMLTTDYPIVGLGTFESSLFVGTTKEPYIVTGTSPSSMSQSKLSMLQPCVSKFSIASDQYGVLYASPNGLVSITSGQSDVITTGLYTRDDWQTLNPASMIGALYNDMYIGFYNVGSNYNGVVMLRQDNPPLVNFSASVRCLFIEPTTGIIYILSNVDNKVYSLDTSTTSNTTFDWKSKKFLHPKPVSYAALQLHADWVYMAAHSGSSLTITIYADGVSVYSGSPTTDFPVRIAAVRAYVWEIEITGNVPVRRINIATTMNEIGTV